jgi:predicted PurR-regulated permease PerM
VLAITGAVVLAIVTQRLHKWITARLKYKALAATTSVALVSLDIIGPAFLLAHRLGHRILSAWDNPLQGLQTFVCLQRHKEE